MIELSTHIEYLLLSHDEVAVPQLGTFVVKNMNSRRVEEEGIFLPPYRTVAFHSDEQEAGEDFVRSLSRLHSLSQEDARIMCVEYVDELSQMLAEDGTASVGSMGYLLRDAQTGQVSFMPMQSGIASPAYYGMDTLPFAKLSNDIRQHRDRKQAVRDTKVTTVVSEPDVITIRINRRVFNYVTTVAASIVLFFTFTSPFGNPIAEQADQKAETELFLTPKPAAKTRVLHVSEPEQPAEPKAEASPVETAVEAAVAEKPAEAQGKAATEEPAATVEPAATEEPAATVEPAKDYAIVIASAISRKSAVNLADKLQKEGYKAVACVAGGMVRVLIPGFESMDEAYGEIHRMREASDHFSNSWPYRVKGQMEPIN